MSERATPHPRLVGAVAVGGALGASARFGVSRVLHAPPHSFPWPTFWTNVAGSLALGFILVVLVDRFPPPLFLRALLATGFLGAFTTYSTFAFEANDLVRRGHAGIAGAYVAATMCGGLAAVAVGMLAGRRLSHR